MFSEVYKKLITSTKAMIIILVVICIISNKTVISKESIIELKLNIPTLELELIENSEVVKKYPVAVGKNISQTPIGQYKIINKVVNPTWYPKGKDIVPPGPDNPLGVRWIGFKKGYGIHGNNNPSSIGNYVSLGCIRLHNNDIKELFDIVEIGTPIKIKYETIVIKKGVNGEDYLKIYPDIYNMETNNRFLIIEKLKKIGVELNREKLYKILDKINKETIIIYLKDKEENVVARDFQFKDEIIFDFLVEIKDRIGYYFNWDYLFRTLQFQYIENLFSERGRRYGL